MKFDEQDVERVAEVIWNNQSGSGAYSLLWHEAIGEVPLPQEVYETRNIARAALEAMERKPVTAEQVQAYCKERGLVVMTKNIAEHLTRQAR